MGGKSVIVDFIVGVSLLQCAVFHHFSYDLLIIMLLMTTVFVLCATLRDKKPKARRPLKTLLVYIRSGLQVLGLTVDFGLKLGGFPSPLSMLAALPLAGTRPDLT